MADERSTKETYERDKAMFSYDQAYQRDILPFFHGTVLDLGCGSGFLAKLAAAKPEVEKIYMLDRYPTNFRERDNKFVHIEADILTCDLPENDVVVSTEFIEHIGKESLLLLLPKIAASTKQFCGSTPLRLNPTTNPFHLHEYLAHELEEILMTHFKIDKFFTNEKNCIIWNVLV